MISNNKKLKAFYDLLLFLFKLVKMIGNIIKSIQRFQIIIDNYLNILWNSPTMKFWRRFPVISTILKSYIIRLLFSFSFVRFIFGITFMCFFVLCMLYIIYIKIYIYIKLYIYHFQLQKTFI